MSSADTVTQGPLRHRDVDAKENTAGASRRAEQQRVRLRDKTPLAGGVAPHLEVSSCVLLAPASQAGEKHPA